MENQMYYVPQQAHPALINQVAQADAIIKQASAWAEEADSFRSLAQKELDEIQTKKKSRLMMRIASPLVAMHIAVIIVGIVSELLGFSFKSSLANTLLALTVIVALVVIWSIPCRIKQHQQNAEAYTQQANQKDDGVNMLLNQYANTIAVIPCKYWYPIATSYIFEVLQTGRATTMPMALDKLEEQLHRWNMEAAMQEALAYQITQTQILRNVQATSAASAAASSVSAAASVANFFLNV